MKNESTTYMDYKMDDADAAALAAIAEELKSIRNNDCEEFVLLTGKYWTGENSGDFLDKVNQAVSKIDRNISRIEKAAQTVTDIAE